MPTQARANLSGGSKTDVAMRKMLARLTPAERRRLQNPDFITEDEADLIVSDRSMKQGPAIPLEKVLAEIGLKPRQRKK
jgi:hypothetical protein